MRDNFFVDFKRILSTALFEVILPQRKIILHGTADEASFYIQVPKVAVDFISRRITLEDLLERGHRFEGSSFRSKGRSRLQIGRCRFARHVPLGVQITDRIVDTAVGRTVNGKFLPLSNRCIILSAGCQQLSLLKNATAIGWHKYALHEQNRQTLTVSMGFV